MRRWIEYIMGFEPAHADFIAHLEEQKQEITRDIVKCSNKGEFDKIAPLAIKLGVYAEMQTRFQAEFRERQAQNQRTERRNNQ